MNKAIKYRIYPTKEQQVILNNTFGACRKVWNLMLSDKIDYYKENKQSLRTTPAQYKNDYPFLKEVDSLALANVQLNLETAYKNFFRDKKVGFPKFKSRKTSSKTYKTNVVGKNIILTNNSIRLPKVGIVKTKVHKQPLDGWVLKSVTISQTKSNEYYASVLFAFDSNITNVPISNNAIGLDYKSDGFYTDSNGNTLGSPKYYRNSQKKLAKLQRQFSRKKTGSNNREKARIKIARLSQHVANQRLDFVHKTSTEIANQYDVVCVESLNLRAMSNKKGLKNGKATNDNGYGMFCDILEYKMRDRGKYFVKVDKWYPSSQICHCCGKRHNDMKNLSLRTFVCDCGYIGDRDYNASLNILHEGLRILKESC